MLLLAAGSSAADGAGGKPVLKQVDLPHSYYWRELYLPQLTTGPSSVSFTPDGASLVYSMAGSLWRQRLDSDQAIELTHAQAAYDYQPDVAGDGRSVVFTRYDGKAHGVVAARSGERTRAGADLGGRGQRRTAAVAGRQADSPGFPPKAPGTSTCSSPTSTPAACTMRAPCSASARARSTATTIRPSTMPINPSWSPDGATIFFVGNPEIAWGTGDIWSVPVSDPGKRTRILSEETSWSARPELAPDGKRLLFSSYRGRQWHQLWLSTVEGAAPLPLTFGDSDRRNARWSPDGRRIAYIGNEHGNTELVVMDVIGGASRTIKASKRNYRTPRGQLILDVVDEHGRSDAGTRQRNRKRWSRLRAGRGLDARRRRLRPRATGDRNALLPLLAALPAGASVRQRRDLGAAWLRASPSGKSRSRYSMRGSRASRCNSKREALPAGFGDWISADLHVHMNYGGHYRNTPTDLARQAQAGDLDLVYNLIVNKEERIPDIGYFRQRRRSASAIVS